jgi:hypothetical protein
MRTLLALALLLPINTLAAESGTVGRLFFTPEQRAQLDTLRVKKVVATQTKDEPPPEVVTYNGIVRRSDGKATVWVNNKALTEGELSTAESVSGRISRDGQILLGNPASGAGKMQLKVGQSAELLSGRVGESYSVLQNTQAPGSKPKPAPTTETNAQAESAPATRQPMTKDGGENSARPAVREAAPSRERASDATAK